MSKGQLLLLKQIIGAGDGTASLPLPKLRANLEAFLSRFPPVEGLEVESVDADGVPCEWLSGDWLGHAQGEPSTVLYFHGGGFVVGSAKTHRHLAARLAQAAGARCLSVDYRLAPEHPYPAALEDAQTAYRWLLGQNHDPGTVAFAGDSAGGGLAVLAASQLRDAGLPNPYGLVAMSPWVDYAGTTPSLDAHAALDPVVQRPGLEKMAKVYLAGADPWDTAVTPLRADLSTLPPLLIQAGGSESLLDDSTRLAETAESAGVNVRLEVWPEMIHVWQLFAGRLDEGRQAIDQAGLFLQEMRHASH